MALVKAQRELRQLANPQIAQHAQGFFKTAPGEYGAGDKFLGVRVPQIRKLVHDHRELTLQQVVSVLPSKWHEERLFAVLALVDKYQRGGAMQRRAVFNAYVKHLRYVNNWDLVDASAYKIIGPHLFKGDRTRVYTMVRSANLWRRRIGIMTTLHWIKQGDTKDTYSLCLMLINDKEDLIHKASGWMLREAGKVNRTELVEFLDKHHQSMPRTMVRYAIEHLPTNLKRRYVVAKSR